MRENQKRWVFGLLFLVFVLLGLFFQFAMVGYRFSALICFGVAALIACYWLLAVLSEKHRRGAVILRRLLTVCVCIGVVLAAVTGVVIGLAGRGSPETECEYIIVLGAAVHGNAPSLSLCNRLDAAYAYLTAHPDAICIVSGGKGDGEQISEARCMYDYLTARGIAPERIWMEERAANTEENLAFSLALIQARTGSRPETVGIVSSEYHLFRAGLFAREQGVTAVGIPGKTEKVSLRINYFLREIAGVWHYYVFGG